MISRRSFTYSTMIRRASSEREGLGLGLPRSTSSGLFMTRMYGGGKWAIELNQDHRPFWAASRGRLSLAATRLERNFAPFKNNDSIGHGNGPTVCLGGIISGAAQAGASGSDETTARSSNAGQDDRRKGRPAMAMPVGPGRSKVASA